MFWNINKHVFISLKGQFSSDQIFAVTLHLCLCFMIQITNLDFEFECMEARKLLLRTIMKNNSETTANINVSHTRFVVKRVSACFEL